MDKAKRDWGKSRGRPKDNALRGGGHVLPAMIKEPSISAIICFYFREHGVCTTVLQATQRGHEVRAALRTCDVSGAEEGR